MAQLNQSEKIIRFKLFPYKITDPGKPSWISTQVALEGSQEKLDDTFSLTDEDLKFLIEGLNKVVYKESDLFDFRGTDENFILRLIKTDTGHLFIEFYFGEPYSLMKGYRFPIKVEDLLIFIKELKED